MKEKFLSIFPEFIAQYLAQYPLWQGIPLLILWVVGILVFLRLLLSVARYIHRRQEAKRLIHLQVVLPRNDSKMDNERRTEKDFHEQIGKAEQFFRSLHETRDLNLYNVVFMRWLWGKPYFSFELQFRDQELIFVVVCDPYYQRLLEKQVTSVYESAEVIPLPPEEHFDVQPEGYYANGYYFHTGEPFYYPIQTYKQIEDDALNTVANAFSKLDKDERAAVQIIAHPMGNGWKKKARKYGTQMFKGKKKSGLTIPIIGPILNLIFLPFKILIRGYDPAVDGGSNAPGADSGDHYVRMLQTEEEIAKSIGEKAIVPGFRCAVRVVAGAKDPTRVDDILNSFFVAFNAFEGKGRNRFENRRIVPLNLINAPIILHNFRLRMRSFLEWNSLLGTEELATMYHFPDARYNKIPTIKWMDYKVVPPPVNLPKEGIILGKSVYRGEERFVRILRKDRTRHTYVVGKSGSGKSVLLWNMAVQDVKNGDGCCVVDPHGDLVEDVLSCVPKERAKDVIVFDPGDIERPMGLNMLEARTPEEEDRASLDAMEIFIKLFGNEIFGPRIQHYFRNGCLTLMADKEEGATLIDIPRLFIDDDFQKYKVSKVKNPMVRAFWENEMAQTGDREKQEMIPYFTSKFGPFVTNTTMRNIIGQTKSAFNVRECMDNQKVLLINLSKGKIGGINAQLLGLIMVAKINMAAMGRVDTPEKDRKDFYLYVDEFQNFATDTFASILSEARKYHLNLIMAHQYIAQLSESAGGIAVGQKDSKIRDAVFGNVGTMVSFKVGAEDGEYLEKEYAPTLSQQDIIGIANYKAYLKLNINNTTSRPFSMQTLYDPSMKNEKIAEIVKKYARMKYGRKKEFVDAEIEARMGIGIAAAGGANKEDLAKALGQGAGAPAAPKMGAPKKDHSNALALAAAMGGGKAPAPKPDTKTPPPAPGKVKTDPDTPETKETLTNQTPPTAADKPIQTTAPQQKTPDTAKKTVEQASPSAASLPAPATTPASPNTRQGSANATATTAPTQTPKSDPGGINADLLMKVPKEPRTSTPPNQPNPQGTTNNAVQNAQQKPPANPAPQPSNPEKQTPTKQNVRPVQKPTTSRPPEKAHQGFAPANPFAVTPPPSTNTSEPQNPFRNDRTENPHAAAFSAPVNPFATGGNTTPASSGAIQNPFAPVQGQPQPEQPKTENVPMQGNPENPFAKP